MRTLYNVMSRAFAAAGISLERDKSKGLYILRPTFVSASLEHGMDIKTLSTIIGHVSSSATLNVYAHITDEMRRTAAKIDQGIGKEQLKAEPKAG